jgi:glucose-1-phosphate adenylyltransferase
VNSGIYNIAVLTQYRPRSLNDHIGVGKPWDLDRARGGIRLLQPYQARGRELWYGGTADAVYQNLEDVREQRADDVLILSGDHIYKMDYRPMLRFHHDNSAELTVAVMNVPLEETDRFGIMSVDADMKIKAFHEKPKKRDKGTLASMGIYIFNAKKLAAQLESESKQHADLDFGKHVIPKMIESGRVYAYPFEGYWVDVGTIQSYWETNLAFLAPTPPLNLYDPNWIIYTKSSERPPVKVGLQGRIHTAMVANGSNIRGRVENSVLSPGVYVSEGAVVRDSVIMNDTWVGPGAVLDRVIVDKVVNVGAGVHLGFGEDNGPNAQEPDKLNTGITVVGKGAHIPTGTTVGRNVVVVPKADEEAFAPFGDSVPGGATVGDRV